MPRTSLPPASIVFGVFAVFAASASAQATAPFWSGYFGGSVSAPTVTPVGRDEIVAIRRGPGNLITLVGHTTSIDLPTTLGAFQQNMAGINDVFVARFDPNQPPSQQLLCTYLGGANLELAFDAEVDPTTGITTVVGLTLSTDFPGANAMNGPSDGFVAVLDASGATLLGSALVGSGGHDRLCEVEVEPGALVVTVAGVTEQQLPTSWTIGTVGPIYRGGPTDAFVARVDPIGQQVAWATHLGGSSTEGVAFANWGGLGVVWEGNLDRMGMTLDPAGRPVLATVSVIASTNAVTTPGAYQTTPTGSGDVYLAIVNLPGPLQTQLHHGTFVGGYADDRPKTIARHPGGGFVIGGVTFSNTYPTTPSCVQPVFQGGSLQAPDGYVTWLDPTLAGAAALRYSTFFGGNAGEDAVEAIAVESSGRITVVGHSVGGNFPTTSRSMQPMGAPPQYMGFVSRIEMLGQGTEDLLYSTFVDAITGNTTTIFNSLVLDNVGDAFVAGATNSALYPTLPTTTTPAGRNGCFTHLPLMPGNVFRDDLQFTNPACGAQIYHGTGKAPVPGETFVITATNAPPSSIGILVLGTALPAFPLPPPFNGTLLASLLATPTVVSDGLGASRFALPIPAASPVMPSWGFAAQWFFFTNATCPGTGLLGNSERLNF
ncbi:MAG: hypothetical protein WAT39_13730 [Planctomycetota bacterium]